MAKNDINMQIVMGNIGKEPELRHTTSGKKVCVFPIATNSQWETNGEKHKHTEWHNVVTWGVKAEACSTYLKKGSKVHVVGETKTRSWNDSEGNTRYIKEIIATDVTFL